MKEALELTSWKLDLVRKEGREAQPQALPFKAE